MNVIQSRVERYDGMSDKIAISMAGIDYAKAGVALREKYAFTALKAAEYALKVKERKQAEECIVLSTCNRTEVWMYGAKTAPIDCIFEEKADGSRADEEYFSVREGSPAVSYLMELACGLHSQIYGEDQIITQIKDALACSRKAGAAGCVLDKLFQTAVAAAKRVKTEVRLTDRQLSSAGKAVRLFEERCGAGSGAGGLAGRKCLVIGCGVMGRLTARELLERGARVEITVRALHPAAEGKPVSVPEGASAVPYEARYGRLAEYDAVFSATASPHYTLRFEETKRALEEGFAEKPGASAASDESGNPAGEPEMKRPPARRVCLIDMAVPRDIDPELRTLAGIELYDMDALADRKAAANKQEERSKALTILAEYQEEYMDWYEFRALAPVVEEIADRLAEVSDERLARTYGRLSLEPEERGTLREQVRLSSKKTVSGLLYGLKEHMERDKWKDCFLALKEAADEYTPVRS